MALVIGKKDTRRFKLKAIEPLDFDATKDHNFEVELKLIPKQRWEDMFKLPIDERPTDKEILEESLLDVVGVVDENKEPVFFSDELKAALLDIPWVVKPIIDSQIAMQAGITGTEYKKQKIKN